MELMILMSVNYTKMAWTICLTERFSSELFIYAVCVLTLAAFSDKNYGAN